MFESISDSILRLHKAEVSSVLNDVRFQGKADIAAKLLSKDEARRIREVNSHLPDLFGTNE
jgi:hypothetical protein